MAIGSLSIPQLSLTAYPHTLVDTPQDLLTEAGDTLVTEGGDTLITEIPHENDS